VATELFSANRASTTVSSGGTDAPASGTQETWTVSLTTGFPAAVQGFSQFHIADTALPSEIIAVTNTSGTTWTVTRGAENTTPVTHTGGFAVYQVLTAGFLGTLSSQGGAGTVTFSGSPGRTVGDAVTNGTTTVTSATAAFTSADTGSLVVITGSADGDATAGHSFASTATYVSSTTITLAAAPSFSITAANLSIGVDNKNAINSWLTSIGNGGTFGVGGRGYVPPGIYLTSGQHTQPGATIVSGGGYDYTSQDAPPQDGSVFMYAGTSGVSYFWQMGSSGTTSTGQQNVVLESVAIDASNLAQSAVLSTSNRNHVRNAMIWRGSVNALQASGGAIWVTNNSVLGQQNLGDVFYAVGGDVHIVNSILRDPGSGGACAHTRNVNDFLFQGNHSWSGGNSSVSSSYPCNNILIDNTSSGSDVDNYTITGNLFDGVYGHAIQLNPTGGGSCRITGVAIAGNSFFAVNGFPDNTYYAVYLNTSANNNVRGLTVTGNAIRGVEGSTNSWAGVLGWAGAGSVTQFGVENNTGMGVRGIYPSALRPDGGRYGNVFTTTCTSSASFASSNDGTATFSGTGSQTAFTIAHGLMATPVTVNLTAGSAAAATPFYWTAGSTNITVTYVTAPSNGTNNVLLSWFAAI
jgi:hypothetical protein